MAFNSGNTLCHCYSTYLCLLKQFHFSIPNKNLTSIVTTSRKSCPLYIFKSTPYAAIFNYQNQFLYYMCSGNKTFNYYPFHLPFRPDSTWNGSTPYCILTISLLEIYTPFPLQLKVKTNEIPLFYLLLFHTLLCIHSYQMSAILLFTRKWIN